MSRLMRAIKAFFCRHILGHDYWPFDRETQQPIPIATASTILIKCRRCGHIINL